MHPDAEDEFYHGAQKCRTIGELSDLAFNFMHVMGRDHPVDRKRLWGFRKK
jgi:hypothetical protein